MKARFVEFGEIELDGRRYRHDVVVQRGQVGRRDKARLEALAREFGHTPLTLAEPIHGIAGGSSSGPAPKGRCQSWTRYSTRPAGEA